MSEDLRAYYLGALPARIEALESSLRDAADDLDARAAMRRIAHSLKGSGASYGFPRISERAAAAETASDSELAASVAELLDELRAAIAEAVERTNDPATILLVDDDEDIVRVVRATLEMPGRRVLAASGIAAAEVALREESPDLVLIDLLLADGDGRSLLMSMRERPATASLPVIVLTAAVNEAVRAECLALGANHVAPKPLDSALLAATVGYHLRRSTSAGAPTGRPLNAAPSTPAETGTILLAEDDDLTASLILHRLRREGLNVEHHTEGRKALQAARAGRFALVILDVKMPGMDGFEVLRELRAMPDFRDTPILMLTSMGGEEDVVRGFELGATDYILKPFSAVELLARVKRNLRPR